MRSCRFSLKVDLHISASKRNRNEKSSYLCVIVSNNSFYTKFKRQEATVIVRFSTVVIIMQ